MVTGHWSLANGHWSLTTDHYTQRKNIHSHQFGKKRCANTDFLA